MKNNNDYKWFKKKSTDKIWWKASYNIGEFIFSFDKQTEFNLFKDYPTALTQKQVELFDSENREWANYFSDRRRR